jgi:hypothetical protein
MTIEIHQPELEAMIQQRMASGAFRDIDELLTRAIAALNEPAPAQPDLKARDIIELFEPIRGLLTDEEIDNLFSRDHSLARPLDLG